MAFLFSGEKYRHLNGDDVGRICSPAIRRRLPLILMAYILNDCAMHARATANRVDGILHRMIEALAAAKMRRLTRELAFYNVRYHRAFDKGAVRSLRTSSINMERKD
jgi:hypothetical protein